MALIYCIECRLLISDTADFCPHCGHTYKKQEIKTTKYKLFEVVTIGFSSFGQKELDTLLKEGWQILDYDDSDTWIDGTGYECRAYKYRLVRN